jgi:hypothetical protein
MSRTIRGRRVSYDNILVGTVASKEITAIGSSAPVSGPSETYFGGSNQAIGATRPTSTDATDNMLTVSGDKTSVWINETIINTN